MLRILIPIVAFAITASAAQRQTAFQAYALVPREAALRLVKIAACEGSPQPERWHFIVHEPQAENGLRDYVIADGQIATVNGASQFAEEVHVEDVLALNSVHIDTAYVAQVATAYAAANSNRLASMNYELHKDPGAGPRWKVTCLDSSGVPFGWIALDAGDGRVVAQSGFETVPAPARISSAEPAATDQDRPRALGGLHRTSPPAPADDDPLPPTPRPRPTDVRRAEPVEQDPPLQRRRVVIDPFRPLRRLFPF